MPESLNDENEPFFLYKEDVGSVLILRADSHDFHNRLTLTVLRMAANRMLLNVCTWTSATALRQDSIASGI